MEPHILNFHVTKTEAKLLSDLKSKKKENTNFLSRPDSISMVMMFLLI
jgi:hypothetical protein